MPHRTMENPVAPKATVRWMIRKDIPRVAEIERDVFEADRWDEDDIRLFFKRSNGIARVIEIDGKIEGYVFYEIYKSRVNIVNIAVHQEFRRQGLGTKLLTSVKSLFASEKSIMILVRESALGVQLFLRANGFRAERIYCGCFDDVDEDGYEFRFVTLPTPEGGGF